MVESGKFGRGDRPSARRVAAQIAFDAGLLDALVQVRYDKGLTQADIARRMGISQVQMSRMENRSFDPRLSTLGRYAHALGVRIVHVVEDDA